MPLQLQAAQAQQDPNSAARNFGPRRTSLKQADEPDPSAPALRLKTLPRASSALRVIRPTMLETTAPPARGGNEATIAAFQARAQIEIERMRQEALQRQQQQQQQAAAAAGGGGGGYGSVPSGYHNLRGEVLRAAQAAGVPAEWVNDPAFIELIRRESGWDPNANNRTSTAHGLFQFLNKTRQNYGMPSYGDTGPVDPYTQAYYGLQYIRDRYGSPANALAFHNRNNWY